MNIRFQIDRILGFIGLVGDTSIGLYLGSSPLDMVEQTGNPVIAKESVKDRLASFVADPFIFKQNGRYFIFYEALNVKTHLGEIAFSFSDDLKEWIYGGIILKKEKHHFSYPYIFSHNGTVYMLPESNSQENLCLFEATKFPNEWRICSVLFDNEIFVDSSIIQYNEKWYLFTTNKRTKELVLYYSDDLLGKWKPHPMNPIGIGRYKRLGGRILQYNNSIYRFSQDSLPTYGCRVVAFRINNLSSAEYSEEILEDPLFEGTGKGWNSLKMHHFDAFFDTEESRWIGVTDGHNMSLNTDIGILTHELISLPYRSIKRIKAYLKLR